jgi:DNA repair exonuclease SbcCD ATPase subunit
MRGRLNLQLKALSDLNLANEAEKLAKLHQEVNLAEITYNEIVERLNDVIQKDKDQEEVYKKIEEKHSAEIKSLEEKKAILTLECSNKKSELDRVLVAIPPLELSEKTLKENIERLKSEIARVEEEKVSRTAEFNNTKNKYEEILRELSLQIIKQRDNLIDLDFKSEFSKKEIERNNKKLNEDNALIDAKKRDLDIYIERLKKEFPDRIFIN